MKKLFLALIIGILVLSGLGAGAINNRELKPNFETTSQEPIANLSPMVYTHTVLVEVGTATWCPSCPASNSAWHSIYAGGNYDFEYTELVYDMNSAANSRFTEFNPKYVPTSYWDAGQYAYPGTSQSVFISYLNSAGARAVPDLVSDLEVVWLGDAHMSISYSVLNNEVSSFAGKIRVYILEIESTMWNDYNGNPYNHALLSFAVNKAINIPAGDTLSETVTWDGSVSFPAITEDNIQVILAVFDNVQHTGYSDPPSGNPFTARYSDECIAAYPGAQQNNPPNKPTIDGPSEGKANESHIFSFSATDPDGDDIEAFIVNWGDGTGDKTITGPFSSGKETSSAHTWTEKGSFTITAKAKDINGAIGPIKTKTISITKAKAKAIYTPLYKLLENHPFLSLIIKLLLHQL
jgi:hypothetical protein